MLGLRLRAGRHAGGTAAHAPSSDAPGKGRLGFRQAVLTGLLNPKSALFLLTFLPHFVDPAAPAYSQFAVLGVVTVVVAGAWHATLIALAAQLRAAVLRRGCARSRAGAEWDTSRCPHALMVPAPPAD